ncbi:MAG: PqqD family protein [Lachnospiraceae bacterium]|nr:PqqD family protein [Lachnospiraceae bacterium]
MIVRKGKITLKNKPNVADLAGEKVMVDFTQGKYFILKGAGNDIWEMLEDGITVEAIIHKLLEEYDVEEKQCEKSTMKFLEQLEEMGFIKGMA